MRPGKIIKSYWTRLSIISWFVDNWFSRHESRYFAISDINNRFCIRSPSLFSLKPVSDSSGKQYAIFHTALWIQSHISRTICTKTHLDGITHEQAIICRQLFEGHVVGSSPMKRKQIYWIIMIIIYLLCQDVSVYPPNMYWPTLIMVTVGPFLSQLLWNIDASQPSVLACQHRSK